MQDGAQTKNSQRLDWLQESGPLKKLMLDPSITEIMVNRFDIIFIERSGVIEQYQSHFGNPDALTRFVNSLTAWLGKEINRRAPYFDARMPDGSRLNIIVPPIALDGPSLTIRKHANSGFSYQGLIVNGSLDEKILYFMKQSMIGKRNILISGGTGSGKTTLLNVLGGFIPNKERVVTIEDTGELQLHVQNLVRMATKLPTVSEPGVTVQDLLKNALRMRPDRIVVGECRGNEAWDMLIAMNTGHEGSIATVHSNSAQDALRRLEAMVMRASENLPHEMIKRDISNTIHLVFQMERGPDGKRRVVEIIELTPGGKSDRYLTTSIFQWSPDEGFRSTGAVPIFVKEDNVKRTKFPAEFFLPEYKIKLSTPTAS